MCKRGNGFKVWLMVDLRVMFLYKDDEMFSAVIMDTVAVVPFLKTTLKIRKPFIIFLAV